MKTPAMFVPALNSTLIRIPWKTCIPVDSSRTGRFGERLHQRVLRGQRVRMCSETSWQAVLPPRRLVGDWELKREIGKPDIDLRVLVGSRVESRNEAVFGAIIGVVTLAFLAPALAEASAVRGAQTLQNAVTVSVLGGMVMWAVDTLALRGRIAAWVQRNWLTDPRRVAIHEAGHVLMSQLLGYQLEDYTLGERRDGPLTGTAAGVVLKDHHPQNGVSRSESFAMIALAGIAAETIVFGDAEGGMEDLTMLSGYFRQTQPFLNADVQASVRWATLAALRVCNMYRAQLEKVAEALLAGRSTQQCLELLRQGTLTASTD